MMNNSDIMMTVICVLAGLAAALMAGYCASIATQITYVTLADGRRQTRALPFMFRLMIPLTPNTFPLFSSRLFERPRSRTAAKLVSAGFDGLLSADEIFGLRILLPLCFGIFWCLFIHAAAAFSGMPLLQQADVPLSIFGVLWLSFYPAIWLKGALARRRRNVERALPFVLDLLTLSVEAGMDFMAALVRCVEKREMDALGEELVRVTRELQLGRTRTEALRDMSERMNMPEIRSVIGALVQASELGVSIGSMLRILADQSRQRRFERAEKLANEAPVKLLFPLLFFIFPSVVLILLAPIIMRISQQVF